VGQGLQTQAMQQKLLAISTQIAADDSQTKFKVDAYYAGRNLGDAGGLWGPVKERKPRILLTTTRFSTVLQHSTRDVAGAFESLGWETRVLIESTNYHRLFRRSF